MKNLLLALLAASPVTAQQDKRIVLVQHNLAARPWQIDAQDTFDHIDSLPFDGFAYNMPITWDLFRGEYGFSEADIEGQFGSFHFSFQNLDQNLISLVIRRRGASPTQGDFFNDAAWAANVEQMRLLARVASKPRYQCAGILFDPEEYFEPVWNYPDDVAFAATYSLDEYQTKARQRGAEMMQALLDEWPEAVMISLHGPYLSAPERTLPGNEGVTFNQVAAPSQYELLGPFQFGFAEAANSPTQVVDGGEVYQLRTEAEFGFNYCWRKLVMASSQVTPPSLAGPQYPLRTQVTFGLYPFSWPDPVADLMTPSILRDVVTRSIERADDWVWLFSEGSRDYLTPGALDPAWIDAVEQGLQAADRSFHTPFDGLGHEERDRLRDLSQAQLLAFLALRLGC